MLEGMVMHEVLLAIRGEETQRRTLRDMPSPGDTVAICEDNTWSTLRVLSVGHREIVDGCACSPWIECTRMAEAATDVQNS
jgi:hypothetical protein